MEGIALPVGSVNYDAMSALVSHGFPRQYVQMDLTAVSVTGGSVKAIIKAAFWYMIIMLIILIYATE